MAKPTLSISPSLTYTCTGSAEACVDSLIPGLEAPLVHPVQTDTVRTGKTRSLLKLALFIYGEKMDRKESSFPINRWKMLRTSVPIYDVTSCDKVAPGADQLL